MFDFARFRRLAAATWSENRRPWSWFFAVGVILLKDGLTRAA